jgi:KDO2-lipid IV(A) lauroyltransferase
MRTRARWSRRRRWKNDAIFLMAVAGVKLGVALPRSWLAKVGSALGLVAYALLGGARHRTKENLALVHPELGADVRAALARRIFCGLGESLTDTVALLDPTEEPERTLGITSEAHSVLESALREGRGVIYVTCHLGPWERMAALLAKRGFPITAVARESYDHRFHDLLYEKLRTYRNIETIFVGDPAAPFALVRALRRGRVVGFLVDLPGRIAAHEVEWLGHRARVPVGPARLALRMGSPVVVGTPAEGEDGRLVTRIENVATSDLPRGRAGEAALCQRIADALSARILALPMRWPWMHPTWDEHPRCSPRA